MWTPELGATISLVVGSSSFLRPSEKGPVALTTPYIVSADPKTLAQSTHPTPDGPGLSSHLVLDVGSADPLDTASRGVRLLVQLGNLDMVGHDGTVLNSSQGERDVHTRVIVLTYIVSVRTS
jgi:hypothetical protein